jgi:uncharacterized membrane protein YhaH (DUF805 family)
MAGYATSKFENTFTPATALRQIARSLDFGGRSTRTEVVAYWFCACVAALAFFMAGMLLGLADGDKQWWLLTAVSVVLAIPEPALFVRRVHDQGRSGWWALLIIPYFGFAWLGGARANRP